MTRDCASMEGVTHGMRPPGGSNRPIERAGVNTARTLFESANVLFQEVPTENDIGKDAYVDLSEGGVFVGDMVALQIKSGESYRHGDDYRVPCDANHRALWCGSSVPIYGLVHDPADGTLHWADLSAWARGLGVDETPSFCPVPRENLLEAETLAGWIGAVRRQVRALVFPPVLNLMTEDGSQQASAAFDCFALGRSDARPLKLLRASLRWLADVDATWPAIQILSLATPHPDVMWADQTWLPDAIREEVVATFRWSMDEVELLLGAPTGEMWGRGDLGQCVYMLLVADPRHEALLEHVASTATDDEVAWSAASMCVSLAGEKGLSTLARLTAANPALKQNCLFAELLATLEEHGHVSMF